MVARNVQVGCLLIFASFILGVIHHIPVDSGIFGATLCTSKCPADNASIGSNHDSILHESFQLRAGETIPLYKFTTPGIPQMGVTARVNRDVYLPTTEFCNARVSLNMHRRREYLIPPYTVIDMDVPTYAADKTYVNLLNRYVLPGTVVSLQYNIVCGSPNAPMNPRKCAKLCNYPTSIPVDIDLDVVWP